MPRDALRHCGRCSTRGVRRPQNLEETHVLVTKDPLSHDKGNSVLFYNYIYLPSLLSHVYSFNDGAPVPKKPLRENLRRAVELRARLPELRLAPDSLRELLLDLRVQLDPARTERLERRARLLLERELLVVELRVDAVALERPGSEGARGVICIERAAPAPLELDLQQKNRLSHRLCESDDGEGGENGAAEGVQPRAASELLALLHHVLSVHLWGGDEVPEQARSPALAARKRAPVLLALRAH
mmetsp:Transcript_16360/g.53462  ORF Transcript_16360/g.53462 Transcript_16360/m.53462 type:complete len:243 (-) Transcript_16360:278-1006(-)